MAFKVVPGPAIVGPINGGQLVPGSVGATALAVGSVTANAIAATAITGKTITGCTINGSVFNGTNWVENANGSFLYSSTPAAGNLVVSLASLPGTDAYGNQYLAGLCTFDHANNVFTQVDGGQMNMGQIVSGAPDVSHSGGFVTTSVSMIMTAPDVPGLGYGDALQFNLNTGQSLQNTGSPNAPSISAYDASNSSPADLLFTGTVIKAQVSNRAPYTWQTPTYSTNYQASTTFNGSTGWGAAQYRLDGNDQFVGIGGFSIKSTWTSGNIAFNVPAPYRPAKQQPVLMARNNGGTVTYFFAALTTSGNLLIPSNTGGGVAASNEYLFVGTPPLNNIP